MIDGETATSAGFTDRLPIEHAEELFRRPGPQCAFLCYMQAVQSKVLTMSLTCQCESAVL